MRSPNFGKRVDGNNDEVVLRIAEHRAFRLGDAHHLERQTLERQRLPNGIAAGKEFGLDVVADEGDVHAPAIFDLGEKAALYRLEIEDDTDVGGGAHQRHALGDLFAAVYVDGAARNQADVFGESWRGRAGNRIRRV